MKKIIIFLAIAICLTGIVKITLKGIEKHEISECNRWKEYSQTYEKFYLATWQLEQCDNYQIILTKQTP